MLITSVIELRNPLEMNMSKYRRRREVAEVVALHPRIWSDTRIASANVLTRHLCWALRFMYDLESCASVRSLAELTRRVGDSTENEIETRATASHASRRGQRTGEDW